MSPTRPAGERHSTSPAALAELVELSRAQGRLALDTEFMGEGRYRTLLCLIQLAVCEPSGERRIELLDPLAADAGGERDAWRAALGALLADPAVEIVVHAGRQDIALLRRTLGCEVSNVFDTQVAAGFIGMAAQCSYEALLNQLLGMRVAKSASFTRWDARPLSDEQFAYAREDVAHLNELAVEIQRRLGDADRLQWAREECRYLEQISDERDVETVFARLPRVRSLSGASQGVARELVAWRERTAAERDRPVQSVLGDAALVEIAKRRPRSVRQLQDIRGVGQAAQRRAGEEVLAATRRGERREHEPLAPGSRLALPEGRDAPLIALCEALVRARAREADLAYELLAARADLQAIVIGERTGERADVRTLRGWRHELVGEELLALLGGRLSLSVDGGRLVVGRRNIPTPG
jgi:ribonuclease D